MEMEHRLPCFGIHVENSSVSALSNPRVLRDLSSSRKHVGQERVVFCRNIVHRRNVFSRTNEYVHRRLWVDVMKGNDTVVLICELCWQFLFQDSAKETG